MNDMRAGQFGPQAPYPYWQGAPSPVWGWPMQAPPGHAQVPPGPAAAPGAFAVPPGYGFGPAGQMLAGGAAAGAAAPAGLANPRFVRGAAIGALAVYLLTNESVQQATIRSLVRLRSLVQGGVEEMKERFRDAEAELHAAQAQHHE